MDRNRPMYNRLPSFIVIDTQDADGNHVPVRFYNEQAIDLFIRRQGEAVYELKKYMERDEEASE